MVAFIVVANLAIVSGSFRHLMIFTCRIPIFVMGIYAALYGELFFDTWNVTKTTISVIIVTAVFAVEGGIKYYFSNDVQWSYGLRWYPWIVGTIPLVNCLCFLFELSRKYSENALRWIGYVGVYSLEIYLIHTQLFRIFNPENGTSSLNLILYYSIIFIGILILSPLFRIAADIFKNCIVRVYFFLKLGCYVFSK